MFIKELFYKEITDTDHWFPQEDQYNILLDILNEDNKLDEIGFSSGVQMPNFSSINLSQLTPIGHIDNEDVFMIKDSIYELYFFKDAKQITDYIALGDTITNGYRDLIRVHKINNAPKGAITALIMFLKKQNIKIRISNNEPLTHQGLIWIRKLIDNPRGLTITDQNGSSIDKQKLNIEWLNSQRTNIDGPTSIYIEGVIYPHELLEKWDGKGLLRPSYRYLGDIHND